jgi:hypothetical protein
MDLEFPVVPSSALSDAVFGHRFPDVWLIPRGGDRAVPLAFEAALTHRLGLDGLRPGFSARLVREYRCYLYLLALSETAVIPSPRILVVDRLYRQASGAPALPRELARMTGLPAALRAAAQEEFEALYRTTFGAAPPGDIWPGDAEHRARRLGVGLMALSTAAIGLVLSAAAPFGPMQAVVVLAGLAGLFIGCSLVTEGAIGDGAPSSGRNVE